jgi:hypothetical protein
MDTRHWKMYSVPVVHTKLGPRKQMTTTIPTFKWFANEVEQDRLKLLLRLDEILASIGETGVLNMAQDRMMLSIIRVLRIQQEGFARLLARIEALSPGEEEWKKVHARVVAEARDDYDSVDEVEVSEVIAKVLKERGEELAKFEAAQQQH